MGQCQCNTSSTQDELSLPQRKPDSIDQLANEYLNQLYSNIIDQIKRGAFAETIYEAT